MRRKEFGLLNSIVQPRTEEGSERLPKGILLRVNETRPQECAKGPQAQFDGVRDVHQDHGKSFNPEIVAPRLAPIQIRVVRVRGEMHCYPAPLEKGVGNKQASKLPLVEMSVRGASTRKTCVIVEQLCSHLGNSTRTSHSAAKLDAELEGWHTRPIDTWPFVFRDASSEKVPAGVHVLDCGVLISLGSRRDGKRTILGVSLALSKAEAHRRSFLADMQKSGMHGFLPIIRDHHKAAAPARQPFLPEVAWQRRQLHPQQNTEAYVARLGQHGEVAQAIRTIFDCSTRTRPTAAKTARRDLRDCRGQVGQLDVGTSTARIGRLWSPGRAAPAHAHNQHLGADQNNAQTANSWAGPAPSEASLLRLLGAFLAETKDEWEFGKIDLSMEAKTNPFA